MNEITEKADKATCSQPKCNASVEKDKPISARMGHSLCYYLPKWSLWGERMVYLKLSVLQFLSLSHFQAIKTIMFSCAQSQSCLTLCYPMGCSLPGSSVHGIFQTRILGWVAIPFSKVSSQPQDRTWVSCVSCIDKWILFTTEPAGKPWLRPQLLLLGNTTLWRPMEPSGKNHQHWWGSREMLAALTHRASRVCLCASNLIQ